MRPLTLLSLLLLPTLALAEEPWGTVDRSAAPALHDKACISCHTRMYGGDGSKMYTRDGRMLSTKLELLQRVAACNAQVSAGWFPEDEGSVAAWLNDKYYHFKE
jgi:hypothetical protein